MSHSGLVPGILTNRLALRARAPCREEGDEIIDVSACEALSCPVDSNRDGQVNVTDLLTMLTTWGPCPAPCAADSNSDGNVNVFDLITLLGAWGPCP